jgi:hypothetical protein
MCYIVLGDDMKTFNINDTETAKRCVNWLRENKYRPFVMQHDWYDKEGFILYLYKESEEIEVHTKIKEVQEMLIGYMSEKRSGD